MNRAQFRPSPTEKWSGGTFFDRLAENLRAMASRLGDLLDPEFRFKPRIAGRRGRGDAHRVTSLRVALSGLGRSKPYDVGRARENSRRCIVKLPPRLDAWRHAEQRGFASPISNATALSGLSPGAPLWRRRGNSGKVGFACARTPSVRATAPLRVAVAPRRAVLRVVSGRRATDSSSVNVPPQAFAVECLSLGFLLP